MAVNTCYEELLRRIYTQGTPKRDRTGVGTRSLFGAQLRYDLNTGFPLLTTKRVFFRGVVGELLWFLSGSTDASWLAQRDIHIWDAWADEDGQLGPVYGYQWRSWPAPDGRHIDQVAALVDTLKNNPDSRRMLVSAWNVAQLDQMALMPCHLLFQVYVADEKLSLQVYQRSCDMFLGVPFNLASYALLAHMLAQQAGLGVGDLVWTGGDCHIYDNHVEQVATQLQRTPRPFPTLKLHRAADMFSYDFADIAVEGYDPHPAIKAPVAV